MSFLYLLLPSAVGSWSGRTFAGQCPEVIENVSCIYVSVLQLQIAAVTQETDGLSMRDKEFVFQCYSLFVNGGR